VDIILETLQTGLPVLILQFAVTLALLVLGIACHMALTPFHEAEEIRAGNTAAGVVFMGAVVALAIPLAATLASNLVTIDIVLWGLVALVLQLLVFLVTARMFRGLREMIEAGNVAAALMLAALQIAVALLNAGTMVG
jgi:putative membrane protein